MLEGRNVSNQTIQRLPVYLHFLRQQKADTVSATGIAEAFGLNEVQVRKDLAAVSASGGRSGVGYNTKTLARDVERFLGCYTLKTAVIAGAGNLGRALMGYKGFEACGLSIRAAVDADLAVAGTTLHGIPVFAADRLKDVCREHRAEIGIIAVPGQAAQAVCDIMVQSGIRAIWNFAPEHLEIPQGVSIRNENLAASLVVLSKRLAQQEDKLQQP